MTLIIGVLCSDGIVVGADGAATLGTIFGQGTIVQPIKKLRKINGKIIIGNSGPVGAAQRILGTIEKLWEDRELGGNLKSFEVMDCIRKSLGSLLIPEIQYAVEAVKLIGQAAAQSAISQTILAIPIEGRPRLYAFGCTGDPEELTPDVPFVAIGSGQNLADPFLAFLRGIFWPHSAPVVSEGIFATVWSLVHAISRNTGGVSEPIQLITLTRNQRGDYVVQELDEEELKETRQAVSAAEEHLSRYGREEGEPPPTPPI